MPSKFRIIQFSEADFQQFARNNIGKYFLLECQVYGKDSDKLYNCAVLNSVTEILSGRVIKDTGRTAGFWQCFGGRDVFHPESSRITFPQNASLVTILSKLQPARLTILGKSWQAIINNAPKDYKNVSEFQTAKSVKSKKK